MLLPPLQNGSNADSSKNSDDDHHSTVVICNTRDDFVLKQDMCMACGSYGNDEEGKLITCTQCGQCYHGYCVNIKVRLQPIAAYGLNANFLITNIITKPFHINSKTFCYRASPLYRK